LIYNLSFKLVAKLLDFFPGTNRVRDIVGIAADDIVVWQHALDDDFVILTKANDFDERSLLVGCPPKIVHLVCGNRSTEYILNLILRNKGEIILFGETGKENCILKIS